MGARVCSDELLGRRDLLVVCWNIIPQFFTMLPSSAQWDLHLFYGPSLKLTDEQTLERIRAARKADPSLSQRAGRHYALIFDRHKSYADRVGRANFDVIRELLRRDIGSIGAELDIEPDGKASRRQTVHALVPPERDYRMLARAFLRAKEEGNEVR